MEYKINQEFRLSIPQFKAIIKGKGWSIQDVADRWGITRTWLSQIINNPDRPPHYDDSVMALPFRPNTIRDLKRRQVAANNYLSLSRVKVRRRAKRILVEEIRPGSLINVNEDIGSIAVLGMRGYVFAIRGELSSEEYGIVFPNGKYDWFTLEYLEGPLAESGLFDPDPYQYKGESLMLEDFRKGRFKFSFDFEYGDFKS